MPQTPLITTLAEACDFIKAWVGCDDDLSGAELAGPLKVPEAVQELNSKLGRLWSNQEHRLAGIVRSRDTILAPDGYVIDRSGIVETIQSAWQFGYREAAPDELWVAGHWVADPYPVEPIGPPPLIDLNDLAKSVRDERSLAPVDRYAASLIGYFDAARQFFAEERANEWRPHHLSMQQVLTFTLMNNFAFSLSLSFGENAVRQDWPAEATQPMYEFNPWGSRGIWTDTSRSHLYFDFVDWRAIMVLPR